MDLALSQPAPVATQRPGLRLPDPEPPAGSPSGADAQRHLWHSRFGLIVIEVMAGEVFVNGQRVQPWRG